MLVFVSFNDACDVMHVHKAADAAVVEHVQYFDLQSPITNVAIVLVGSVWIGTLYSEAANSAAILLVFVQDGHTFM